MIDVRSLLWILALGACGAEAPPPPASTSGSAIDGVWLAPRGALVLRKRGDELRGAFTSASGTRYPIRGGVANGGGLAFFYGSEDAPWQARLALGDRGQVLAGELTQVHADVKLAWSGVRLDPSPDREIAALAEALRRDEAPLRRAAADVLGALGAEARAAVPSLVEALGDVDAPVSDAAEFALARVGPADADAAAELLCGLRSSRARVRIGAADALAVLGASSPTAVASLEAALEDPEPDVRDAAARALGRGPAAPGGFWPQWRGPRRDNVSTETGLLQSWPAEGPRLLWTNWTIGRGIAGPAVRDGRVYTLGYAGDVEVVSAIDEGSGRRVWARAIGPSRREDGFMRWLFQRTPTVDRDLLFAFTSEGTLVALRTSDGREAWRRSYPLEFGTKNPGWGMSDYPLVDGARLICVPAGGTATLAALDKATGSTVWTSKEPAVGGPSHGAAVECELGGERQFVALLNGGLFGFRARDGKTLWSHGGDWRTLHSATPIAAGGRLVVPYGYFSDQLAALDVRRREETWVIESRSVRPRHRHGIPQCSTLVAGGSLYEANSRSLSRVDVETGAAKWTLLHPASHGASMTWADGKLYVHYSNGRVALVGDDGRVISEAAVPGPVSNGAAGTTTPVVAGGRLYIRAETGLFCYDVRGDAGGRDPRRSVPVEEPLGLGPLPRAVAVPTPPFVVDAMIDLAGVKAGDVVVDLGSGDGRLLIAAAKRGAKAVGYEIDEALVKASRENARREGVEVRVEARDLFTADLAEADVLLLYLNPTFLDRLRPRLLKLKPGARIVSHEFEIPGVKPDRSVRVPSPEDANPRAIHLWTAPLKLD